MARYVILLRNDRGGAMQMLFAASAGAADVQRAVEALGGSVEAQHVVDGRFDHVVIAAFPDEAGPLAYALAATSHGQYAELLRVFDPETLDAAKQLNDSALERDDPPGS